MNQSATRKLSTRRGTPPIIFGRLFMKIPLRRKIKTRGLTRIGFMTVPLLFSAISCRSDVTISMTTDIPPVFSFERGHVNYLDFFMVKEIAPENQNLPYMRQDTEKNIVLWQIWPRTSADGRIDNLPTITYAQVPGGFVQKVPDEGAPAALVEGKVYEAGGPPVTMSRGFLRFVIRNGKAVRVPILGQD
jgi:hypothetical protein